VCTCVERRGSRSEILNILKLRSVYNLSCNSIVGGKEGGKLQMTQVPQRAAEAAAEVETFAERVHLCLCGVKPTATVQTIGEFLYRLTGFHPTLLELEPSSFARATLTGKGATHAAAEAAGTRSDADRVFEMLQMHNDWYCPCGSGGDKPMKRSQVCRACGQERPGSFNEAAAAAAERAVELPSGPLPLHPVDDCRAARTPLLQTVRVQQQLPPLQKQQAPPMGERPHI
jgi:CDGSH-type Zn-finger protein